MVVIVIGTHEVGMRKVGERGGEQTRMNGRDRERRRRGGRQAKRARGS